MSRPALQPVTAAVCGAGVRGYYVYGHYARRHPDRLRFVAVAEPNEVRRRRFQRTYGIPDELAFRGWEELFSRERLCQAALVCTPDTLHYAPARRALDLGYHLLLEKPISPVLEECQELAGYLVPPGQVVLIAHVLRYSPFWKKLKETVDSGRIGQLIHIDLSENVAFWHFGHSYVRGNYGVSARSSPLILAKACHDLDLIYWILGQKADSVESIGSLMHFRPENAPAGAPKRCTDGCPVETECIWYAPRLYIPGEPVLRTVLHARSPLIRAGVGAAIHTPWLIRALSLAIRPMEMLVNWKGFPSMAISEDLSVEGKKRALREGPYGRCIYRCGNDVVDHQVALFRFPSGTTATLTVHGFSEFEGRELRLFGTKGVLRGVFRIQEQELRLTDHRLLHTELLFRHGVSPGGHGGGDWGMFDTFTAVLRGKRSYEEANINSIADAMESHFMAFAAERARLSGGVTQLEAFRRKSFDARLG